VIYITEYTFKAYGHHNVTSQHKSTFEVTQDKEIGLAADCIVGVSSDASLNDLPAEMRKAIADENTKIKIILNTDNSSDEITGYGHPSLTLDHPTDMVCRKSNYTCSRTLMINKAAKDLKPELIDDLRSGMNLTVTIIV